MHIFACVQFNRQFVLLICSLKPYSIIFVISVFPLHVRFKMAALHWDERKHWCIIFSENLTWHTYNMILQQRVIYAQIDESG